MGHHHEEIKAGREIPPGTVTPYLCWSNHTFLIIGPHVFCRCGGARQALVLQKPGDHDPCPAPCQRYGYHEHTDGTHGNNRSDVERVFCFCGDRVKRVATFKRAEQQAATSTYLLAGYNAAAQLFTSQTVHLPPHRTHTYDDDLLPGNFPGGR